ncbi:MAG: galactokinase, partial [Deltaproteobacteria bacterium]
MNLNKQLDHNPIRTSVPCRVDFGGTLDISTLFLPLQHLSPSSFNIALNLRTFVSLSPWKKGFVKVSSKGFESAVFKKDQSPFDHPLGLMFACATYFNA